MIYMGRFQPVLAFDLLTAHTFLGSFSALDYFRPITGLFPQWAKFGPSQESARYWHVPLIGQIWPMARVGPLLACYPNGPNSAHGKSWPVSGLLTCCAVSSPSYILAH